jgi:hypothetical protein
VEVLDDYDTHPAVSGLIQADNGNLTSLAHGSRNILKWLVRIFALCVVVQVFLAGAAVFTNSDYWIFHSNFPDFLHFFLSS